MNEKSLYFEKDKLLKNLSTFAIGGMAKYFVDVKTAAHMCDVITFCNKEHLRYLVIGKGSNCLFDDQGFDGVIIRNGIDFCEQDYDLFHIGAGYSFSLLGALSTSKCFSGLEFAAAIPGSVGGAVFMNAEAYGQQTSDCLKIVNYIDKQGNLIIISKEKLQFGYRYSSFQGWEGAIVSVLFNLVKSKYAKDMAKRMNECKQRTQPLDKKSAGCVFCNPNNVSAGKLIEDIGLKNFSIGDAVISDKHANFIINKGNAKSKDVIALIDLIKNRIKSHYGIELKTEIQYIPYKT